jgi:hypothetical protein
MVRTTILVLLVFLIVIAAISCQSGDETVTTPTTQGTARPTLAPSGGTTYYVSANGHDDNPGTAADPWATIQHAVETIVAGDTVFIRGGIYHEHVQTVNSGSAEDGFITFATFPGETPVIDGQGVEESQNGIVIAESYIKLVGLEICNWGENAIWIENAAYIEISDCEVHDVFYGIGVADGTHDFTFNRINVHHFDLYGFDVSPSGGADCYNGIFNDCIAHSASDPAQNVDGFALGHGTQHDFTLNRCQTYEVYDGFDISARNTTLSRCSAYKCWNSGYKLWQDNVMLVNCLSYNNENTNIELDWDAEPGTSVLQNCTFMDAQTFNIWIENSSDSLEMYNCIVAGGDNVGLAFEQMSSSNYKGDYNLFQNDNADRAISVGYEEEFSLNQLEAWKSYSGQDSHSISINSAKELFVDLDDFDLHLSSASPAVDNGTNSGAPSDDYDGNIRPQGVTCDIGAFEYSP